MTVLTPSAELIPLVEVEESPDRIEPSSTRSQFSRTIALSDNVIVLSAELIVTDAQSTAEIPIALGDKRPALSPTEFPLISGPEYPAPPAASSA